MVFQFQGCKISMGIVITIMKRYALFRKLFFPKLQTEHDIFFCKFNISTLTVEFPLQEKKIYILTKMFQQPPPALCYLLSSVFAFQIFHFLSGFTSWSAWKIEFSSFQIDQKSSKPFEDETKYTQIVREVQYTIKRKRKFHEFCALL